MSKTKPKILILVTQSVWGGAQRYVYDLSLGLGNKYDVSVGVGLGGDLISKLKQSNIDVVELPELVRPINLWKDLLVTWHIFKLIKKEHFELIHTNSSKAGLVGRLAARFSGVPSVHTIHGLVLNEPLNPLTKLIYWIMEKIGAMCGNLIISVSQRDKDSAIKYQLRSPEKIKVINIASEKKIFPSKPHQEIVIGTIANFFSTKGYKYYLPAIAEVLKQRPGVKFKIVGVGPEENWFKHQLVILGISGAVEIIHNPTEAWRELSGFDIFVLPSVKEGMPYTIFEAMHAGLAIVATRVGGIPEQIRDGESGIIVPPADSTALAEAITTLINDPALRKKLGKQAKVDAANKFSLVKMIGDTEAVYEKLLS